MIAEITMKKTFVLEDLDCANCAAKIENAVKELEHVISASVSFMTQKLKPRMKNLRKLWPRLKKLSKR